MSDWIWERSSWLLGLWLLPLFIPLAILTHRAVVRSAKRFAGEVMWSRIMPPLTPVGPALQAGAFVLGAGLVVVGLAGPAWDFDYVPSEGRGLDVAVALDVSRSMLADDGGESRLDRAKSAIASLVDGLAGDRVGLVLFAGQSLVTCPLTFDRAYFQQALRDASPGVAGRGGTLIGPALERALGLLDETRDRDRVVLLMTDAGDQDSFPRRVAEKLNERKVRVLAVGVGRTNRPDQPLIIDGQVIRDEGKPVLARVDEGLLRDLAESTRGLYVPPEEVFSLPQIYDRYVAPLEKGEGVAKEVKRYRTRYQWFMGPGWLLLLLACVMRPYPRRSETEEGAGQPPAARRGSRAAVWLLPLLLLASCGGGGGAFETALGQFEAGDHSAAAEAFSALESKDDRPSIAFALGCARAAADDESGAREAFGRVLSTGDKDLRARATVALAALDAKKLIAEAGDDPVAVKAERRDELRDRTNAILDRLQRARFLAPEWEEVEKRQADLSLWLRLLEDDWATRDREALRVARRERPGRAFLEALRRDQMAIEAGLLEGTLRANLALDQRALTEDLRELGVDKAKESPGGPLEPLAETVLELLAELPALMDAGEAELAAADPTAPFLALPKVRHEQTRALILWSPLEAALKLGAEESGHVGQYLPVIIQRARSAGFESEMGKAEGRLRGVQAVLDAVARRIEVETEEREHPAYPFVARAIEEARKQAATLPDLLNAAELDALIAAAQGAARWAQLAAEEWALTHQPPARIARTLSRQVLAAVRELSEFDALAGASPEQIREQLFARLDRRVGYLWPVIELGLAQPDASGQAPGEDELAQRRQAMQPLEDYIERARTLLGDARAKAKASLFEIGDEVREPMHAARRELRTVWLLMSSLEDGLAGAVEDAKGLGGGVNTAARTALASPDDQFPRELTRGPLHPNSQLVEQRMLLAAIQHLIAISLPGERAQLEAAAPSGATEEEASPVADLAPAEAAMKQALAEVETALQDANKAGQSVVKELSEPFPTRAPLAAVEFFKQVAPPLDEELRALLRAQAALERAKIPLMQLAQATMLGSEILSMVGDGLKHEAPIAISGAPKDHAYLRRQWTEGLLPLMGTWDAALDRWKRQNAPQPAEGQDAPDPNAQQGFESAVGYFETLIDQIQELTPIVSKAVEEGDFAVAATRFVDLRDRARQVWQVAAMPDFQGALKQAIQEEQLIAQQLSELSGQDEVATTRKTRLALSQRFTAGLIPFLERQVEALGQGQGQGQGGGLSEEVVALAQKNLPAAAAALEAVEKSCSAAAWDEAQEAAAEAIRLLEELLEQSEDDSQDSSSEPEPQPQEQEQEQAAEPQDGSEVSEDERQRRARAIQERARDLQKNERRFNKRAPVEKDW